MSDLKNSMHRTQRTIKYLIKDSVMRNKVYVIFKRWLFTYCIWIKKKSSHGKSEKLHGDTKARSSFERDASVSLIAYQKICVRCDKRSFHFTKFAHHRPRREIWPSVAAYGTPGTWTRGGSCREESARLRGRSSQLPTPSTPPCVWSPTPWTWSRRWGCRWWSRYSRS